MIKISPMLDLLSHILSYTACWKLTLTKWRSTKTLGNIEDADAMEELTLESPKAKAKLNPKLTVPKSKGEIAMTGCIKGNALKATNANLIMTITKEVLERDNPDHQKGTNLTPPRREDRRPDG